MRVAAPFFTDGTDVEIGTEYIRHVKMYPTGSIQYTCRTREAKAVPESHAGALRGALAPIYNVEACVAARFAQGANVVEPMRSASSQIAAETVLRIPGARRVDSGAGEASMAMAPAVSGNGALLSGRRFARMQAARIELARPAVAELRASRSKSLERLSTAEAPGLTDRHADLSGTVALLDLIVDYPVQSIGMLGALGAAIVGILILLLWQKERTIAKLRKKAMEDGLTRLYNASACRKLVTQRLAQVSPDAPGVFIIMDLDNFKEINDSYGHQIGDQVLARFAELLRSIFEGGGIVARIGRDEFAAYLDCLADEEALHAICAEICGKIHGIHVGERQLTTCIGAVIIQKDDNYDSLYRMADDALYQAKRKQKDHYCIAKRDGSGCRRTGARCRGAG